jgi:hypothetical protein
MVKGVVEREVKTGRSDLANPGETYILETCTDQDAAAMASIASNPSTSSPIRE